MTKTDSPPFLMIVRTGPSLTPATAWDAERLDTYRQGSTVLVRFTPEDARPKVRRWWATLGLVVKHCNVPWTSKEQASDAMKLALGISTVTKTITGEWRVTPKSLNDLDDPDLDQAVIDMEALIYRMTGIDPATLKKEMPDTGDETPDQSPPDPVSGAEEAQSSQDDSAPLFTPAAADPGGGETTASAPPPHSLDQRRECVTKFMDLATANDLALEAKRRLIMTTKEIWKADMPHDHDFLRAVVTTADRVAKGGMPAADGQKYLEGLIGG